MASESTTLGCMLFASPFPCAVVVAVCVCSIPAASLHVLNKRNGKGCPSCPLPSFVDCEAHSFPSFVSETPSTRSFQLPLLLFDITFHLEISRDLKLAVFINRCHPAPPQYSIRSSGSSLG